MIDQFNVEVLACRDQLLRDGNVFRRWGSSILPSTCSTSTLPTCSQAGVAEKVPPALACSQVTDLFLVRGSASTFSGEAVSTVPGALLTQQQRKKLRPFRFFGVAGRTSSKSPYERGLSCLALKPRISVLLNWYGELKRVPKERVSLRRESDQFMRGKGILSVLPMKGGTHAQHS
jgi:hypothetical protein